MVIVEVDLDYLPHGTQVTIATTLYLLRQHCGTVRFGHLDHWARERKADLEGQEKLNLQRSSQTALNQRDFEPQGLPKRSNYHILILSAK
jgi:hypothetical protein